MNESFSATIKFALLVLAMLFTANLYAAGKMAGISCVWGAAFAILATGLAYGAQHYFSQAALWYEQHMKSTLLGGEPWIRYEKNQLHGQIVQIASVVAGAVSGFLFLVGAL